MVLTYIYLVLYMDVMLISTNNMAEIKDLKALLESEFEMKDLGIPKKVYE